MQSGGQFEIDYEVVGPNGKVILKDSKERQGDFVFTALNIGEYRFCFSNEGYTASDKMVDFEIAVRQPPAIPGPFHPYSKKPHLYPMSDTFFLQVEDESRSALLLNNLIHAGRAVTLRRFRIFRQVHSNRN